MNQQQLPLSPQPIMNSAHSFFYNGSQNGSQLAFNMQPTNMCSFGNIPQYLTQIGNP